MEASKRELNQMVEVVTIAIPREIDTYQFYMNAAKRSVGENAKKLFEALAQQEKAHENLLKGLLDEIKTELRGKS